ncbi:uncharacterized protein [Clytia hemisphaerica]|uniref:VWFA domain-containing protein n=1 Tax=Clytia hemisphaerica TaxID=252671 RepID=A0A7M6DNR3_9CNID|eukprot:TCONS_00005286-protein
MYSRKVVFLLLLVNFVYSFEESEEESGSGIDPGDKILKEFEALLSNLKDTDLLVMVDVTQPAENFTEALKNISKDAVPCMKKFSEEKNSVSVMTFSSTPQLIIDFDSPCLKDIACMEDKGKTIKTKNEARNLKKALRKAKQHLSHRKKIFKDKKQLLLLITFGADEPVSSKSTKITKTNVFSRIGKKFSRDDVTVAVVGIGKEAIKQKSHLSDILHPEKKNSNEEDKYLMFSEEDYITEILMFSVNFTCVDKFNDIFGMDF